MLKSRQENGILSEHIDSLQKDKKRQLKQITEMKETLITLGLGADFAMQREIDLRELRVTVEGSKQMFEKLKLDIK